MPDLRRDPIVGRWVIIATERGRRPSDVARPPLAPQPAICPFDQQHARGIARTRRAQRDPVGGKVEIEGINSHRAPLITRGANGKRCYCPLSETAEFSMSAVISCVGAAAAGGALPWLASDACTMRVGLAGG